MWRVCVRPGAGPGVRGGVDTPPGALGGSGGELDAWPRSLGYSPAIASLRAKSVAGSLAAVALAAAVAGELARGGGDIASPALAARPATPLPVTVRLPTTSRFELLAGNALPARLRMRRAGRVKVTPTLRVAGARPVPLGSPRRVTLPRRRWTAVSLPLSAAGRTALGSCPQGRIAVTVSNRRVGRTRTAGAPLALDAPACARFFGPNAVWNTPLPADAPLDPDSAAVTADLLKKVDAGFDSDKPPTINTTAFAPPVYTVAADQPTVRVHLDRGRDFEPQLSAAFAAVPLPPGATPAPGSDGELVVWQPATDKLWEFWRLRRENGRWFASWGGKMDDVSNSPGHWTTPHANWGPSASSLSLVGGLITPRQLDRGEIDHALAIGMPFTRRGVFSLPAQRTDGESPCEHAPPEGARFRLDPAVDVDALGLPPAVATLARAAQRYGIYVRDQAGAVAFYAQSTVSLLGDPYPALFGGQRPYDLLRSFPWQHLQLVKMELRAEAKPDPPLLGPPNVLHGC
jgi:hypothetical protein